MKIIVKCPICKSIVPDSEYNLETSIAQCIECNNVFSFDSSIAIAHDNSHKKVEQPDGISIEDTFSGQKIIMNQGKLGGTIFSVAFGLFFIIIPFFSIKNLIPQIENNYWALLPIAIFLLIGGWQIYRAIMSALTQTIFTVERENLKIDIVNRFKTTKTIFSNSKDEIEQIFVRKRVIDGSERKTTYYDLGISLINGHVDYVLKNHLDRNYVLYLETTLERLLNIEDQPHRDEMRSSDLAPKNLREAIKVARHMYKNR